MRSVLIAIGASLFLSACASTPRQVTVPPVEITESSPAAADLDELSDALAAARDTIAARTVTTPDNISDVEAASSIAIPDHPSVASALRYFTTGRKEIVQRSLTRSARYKAMIDEVLDEYALPRALAYLPVIESAFVPTLTSRAGAHGLWQFMPATGREYGLHASWWSDDRAHPQRSTRAAATYLRALYRQFGDWSLALAAYNAGPGRVRRAMQSSGSRTFWELLEKEALPAETRGYVPTFYATVIIAGDPQRYGFTLPAPQPRSATTIAIHGPVSLEYLAAEAGTTTELLQELNPHFRRGLVPPGSNEVRVPTGAADRIATRAATLRQDDPIMAVASFTLRPGDSLEQLASVTGADLDEILAMNDLRSRNAGPGTTLYLPVRQVQLSTLLSGAGSTHTVRRGETLYSIARSYGVGLEELLEFNRLDAESVIRPGDELVIPPSSLALTAGGM